MTQQGPYHQGVTLAGGAPFTRKMLDSALCLAPHPVAADGGADALMRFGVVPELVIGDMDSLHGALPPDTRILPITEQDSTDFGKCLAHLEAPFIIGVGFLGERLDHTLAALSVLLEYGDHAIVLLGERDVAFVAPPHWSMTVEPGTRVSFYPLLPSLGIASSGLRWPIEGLSMTAGGQIGTSNEAAEPQISAQFSPRGIVTILPAQYLAEAVRSITRS